MFEDHQSCIIMQIDSKMLEVQAAQDLQAIKDEAQRTQRIVNACKAWSDPEEIAKRRLLEEEQAAVALERGRRMGRDLDEVVIPDPLPKEMRGQSLSTIKAMLRQKQGKEEESLGFGLKLPPSTFHVRSK